MKMFSARPFPTARRLLLAACLLLLLLFTAASAAPNGAGKPWPLRVVNKVKDRKLKARLTKLLDPTVQMLEEVIVNKRFHARLREAMSVKREDGDPLLLDICRSDVVLCDVSPRGVTVVGLTVDTLDEGYVNWAKVPPSVRTVAIRNSVFSQSWALLDLPEGITNLTLENVEWTGGLLSVLPDASPAGGASNSDKRLQLQELVCVRCTLKNIELEDENCDDAGCLATYAPHLVRVTITDSPTLESLAVTALPPSLKALTLQNLASWTPGNGITVRTLLRNFPGLQSLVVANTALPFSLGYLQDTPKHLVTLDVATGVGGTAAVPGASIAMTKLVEALQSMPATLEFLGMAGRGVTGPLSAIKPIRIPRLDLARNGIHVDTFASLPDTLTELNISGNVVSGTTTTTTTLPPLTQLPKGLEVLDCSHCSLTGGLDLTRLPPNMSHIDVSSNKLSGTVDTTKLPDSIRYVYLQNNDFTGEVDLVDLPVLLRRILVYGNNWDWGFPK